MRGLSLPDQIRAVARRHLIGCSYLFIADGEPFAPHVTACFAEREEIAPAFDKSARPEGPPVGRDQLFSTVTSAG